MYLVRIVGGVALRNIETPDISHEIFNHQYTLPVKMFGPFWSVWSKTDLAEVGVSLP